MTRKLKDVGNEGNPNKTGDFNQGLQMGDAIKLGTMSTRRAVASNLMDLGDGFRMKSLTSVYATKGGSPGALTVQAVGVTPTAGQVALDRSGRVVFAAADAITEAEVVGHTIEGNTIDLTTSADGAGLVAFLNGETAHMLISCEQLSGAAQGSKAILARGATPGTGDVAIDDAGAIQLNAEAADEQVRVKFVAFPSSSTLDRLGQDVQY